MFVDRKCGDPRPIQAEGGDCKAGHDCESGNICFADPADNYQTSAKCAAPRQEGESCRANEQDCAGEALVCVDSVCRTAKVKGEDCGKTEECGNMLICDSERKCAEMKAEGQGCTADAQCQSSLECQEGVCRPRMDGEVPVGTQGGKGATCRSSEDCEPTFYCGGGDMFSLSSKSCTPQEEKGGKCTNNDMCSGDLVCKKGEFSETCYCLIFVPQSLFPPHVHLLIDPTPPVCANPLRVYAPCRSRFIRFEYMRRQIESKRKMRGHQRMRLWYGLHRTAVC